MSEPKMNDNVEAVAADEEEVSAERLQVESEDKAGRGLNTSILDFNGTTVSNCHYSCKEYRAMGGK